MYPNRIGFLIIPGLEWKSISYGLIKLLCLFLFKILRANLRATKNTDIRRLRKKKVKFLIWQIYYFIRSFNIHEFILYKKRNPHDFFHSCVQTSK